MRAGFTASLLFHGGLLAVGLLTLQNADALNPGEIEAIPIDLVPIEEFTNIRLGSLESEVIETEAPSTVDTETPAELAEPTGNTEDDQPRPEQTEAPTPAPTVQTAPEPQPLPEPEPAVETVLDSEPTPPEPEPQPEPEPTPPAVEEPPVLAARPDANPEIVPPVPPRASSRVEAARQRFAENRAAEEARLEAERQRRQEEAERQRQAALQPDLAASEVSDIINNEDSRGATTGAGGAQTAGRTTGRAAQLSQNETDALIDAIRECWSAPFGAKEAGIVIEMRFELDAGGGLVGNPQATTVPGTQLEQATVGSIDRAIRRCAPFSFLPREAFEQWRIIEATFRAEESL